MELKITMSRQSSLCWVSDLSSTLAEERQCSHDIDVSEQSTTSLYEEKRLDFSQIEQDFSSIENDRERYVDDTLEQSART